MGIGPSQVPSQGSLMRAVRVGRGEEEHRVSTLPQQYLSLCLNTGPPSSRSGTIKGRRPSLNADNCLLFK